MNALTATTAFCPNSFQLKLALSGRRSSLGFARTQIPELDRRRVNFAPVRSSSGVNGSGVERRTSGNSTWIGVNSSADNFSGWANADGEKHSEDSKRKQSLVGILGAGAAGVLLVSGLTFAALSLGKRNTSRVKEQMEPLTTEQEKALSSDEFRDQSEKDKSEEKFGMLESGSEESYKGNNPDLSFNKDDGEANESGTGDDTGDDTGMRQSSEDGDLANTSSSVSVAQSESAINYSMGSPKVTDTSSISDITDGSVDVPNIQSDNQSVAAEDPNDTAAEKLGDISEASLFDAKSENLNTDHPNGVSDSNVLRNSNLSQDPSSVEPSAVNSSLIETDAVIESNTIQEVFMESERVLSTSDAEPIKEMMAGDVGPSNFADLSVDKNDKSAVRENLSGSIGAALVPEVAYQSAFNDINVGRSFFDSTNPGNFFTSAGIPAPSLVSAALQAPQGKVLVPAAVDQLQNQALSALQVLKVIEDDVQPGDLCTRREYARWLVLASSALSRNTTSKVYPAMYIENVSELAFDDITPEDPDFPSIQGLAEAGLIASKLSRRDMQSHGSEDQSSLFFSPESPLSRQDLVSWKMALDKRQLPVVDRKTLQQLSGFIDIDKIDPDAWPALAGDLAAGEQGIVTLAFGYTRLFQPEKPVTKAQAAIALSTGDASAMVSEELARIEAESMAEKAVAAHNALVSQAEKELNASYEEQLSLEREKIDAVQRLAEEARKEVEKLRAEREEENLSLMKERAAVDSEMEILSRLRREVEEQLQTLMSDKFEISYEKERLNKLRRDAETENQEITRLQYELEVEQKALSMARAWAEDEAKRAREKAKTLEEARDRWERQGLKVVVDDDLREEEAEAGVTWLAAGKQFAVEETIDRSEGLLDKLKAMANEVSGKCKVTINKIIEMIVLFISNLKKKAIELKGASKSTFQNSLQGVRHSSSEFTSSVKEGAKRVAGDWKEGVERLSQKFKT